MSFASLDPFAVLDVLLCNAGAVASALRASSLADQRGCTSGARSTR